MMSGDSFVNSLETSFLLLEIYWLAFSLGGGGGVICAVTHNYENRDMGDILTQINGRGFIEKTSYAQVNRDFMG